MLSVPAVIFDEKFDFMLDRLIPTSGTGIPVDVVFTRSDLTVNADATPDEPIRPPSAAGSVNVNISASAVNAAAILFLSFIQIPPGYYRMPGCREPDYNA